ncbi:MAG TPA: hypothetical protein VK779_10980 [Rhizomicrobium sp.]|jgi:hypothetical protein|nr:hypothetical protein [Rhizomicrobium sp.]
MAAELTRGERLQIMLTQDELRALDDWRFKRRMPSRAAAIRELLKRGLAAEGFVLADDRAKSQEFGVITDKAGDEQSGDRQDN